jgi:hypothetical protein
MSETNDLVKDYIEQYSVTEKKKENNIQYKIEFDKLFNIFAKLKYNEFMGMCKKECKQAMLLQPIDNGWGAVCNCSESFCFKIYD